MRIDRHTNQYEAYEKENQAVLFFHAHDFRIREKKEDVKRNFFYTQPVCGTAPR